MSILHLHFCNFNNRLYLHKETLPRAEKKEKFLVTVTPRSKKNECYLPLELIKAKNYEEGRLLCLALSLFWKGFAIPKQQQISLKLQSNDWIPAKNKNNWVFYSGSFNPWHKGHAYCLEAFKIKKQLVIVPDNNPWKDDLRPKDFNPWSYYLDLRKQVKNKCQFIYPGFLAINRAEKNPTYNWIKNFTSPCSLLMGLDSFISLPQWYESIKLIKQLKAIYVVNRGSAPSMEVVESWAKKHNHQLKIFFQEKNPELHISSSKIRNS